MDSYAETRPEKTTNQENEGVEEAAWRKENGRPGEKSQRELKETDGTQIN